MNPLASQFETALNSLPGEPDRYAVEVVSLMLRMAQEHAVSDVHLLPQPGDKLDMSWRIDGVLTPVCSLTKLTKNIVSRLKVLAHLLTYRTDVPQEGRIQGADDGIDMRISTFPTLHGEKAVIRLFVAPKEFHYLEDLGLAEDILTGLNSMLNKTSGVVVIAGPAGTGKTTTLYASLRTILRDAPQPRSLCTLEDPVEALIPGIAQTQVKRDTELTYQRGLASLMRQDPDVIMVGEIRDHETAQTVFQASLTGQLVLTSFHAGSAAEALSRLSDMGIEPYVIRSGLSGILAQQLLRRCCSCVTQPQTSSDCPQCHGTNFDGRMVLAELLTPDFPGLTEALLQRAPAQDFAHLAANSGMRTLRQAANAAVEQGLTTELEVFRVLGPA